MEDYEIADVRQRRQESPSLIAVDAGAKGSFMACLEVSNIGTVPAMDVSFEFSKNLSWKQPPRLFAKGTRYFPPGKMYRFTYASFLELFAPDADKPTAFDVYVTYTHGKTGSRLVDTFQIDLMDYHGSDVVRSDLAQHGEITKKSFEDVVRRLDKLNGLLEDVRWAFGETGLSLSLSTLWNLHRLVNGEPPQRIDPRYCDHRTFNEALNLGDMHLAVRLEQHFRRQDPSMDLRELDGMTPELIRRFWTVFCMEGYRQP